MAKLIEDAQRAAEANGPDCISTLSAAIRAVIDSEADPYVLAGALAEAIAVTIATRIPKEKQSEVSAAAMRALYERMKASGTLGFQ